MDETDEKAGLDDWPDGTNAGEREEEEDDEESNNRYYEIFVNEIRRKEQLEQIEKETN